jgi:uncharacterized protein YbjT (DUF2867 family)
VPALKSHVGNLVLIIGGSRSTGLHAAHILQRMRIPVRVLARDPVSALKRLGPGFDIVPGDLTDRASLLPALEGVSQIIVTAGVRSGRFARQSVVRATEYGGILNTIEAAHTHRFGGRFVYMTSIGVRRRSLFALTLNLWKGNTLRWRHRAEDAIRSSGLDYTIVRAAFLLNRPPGKREISVRQAESPLTFRESIARADAAEALVEALYHPHASRSTFEIKWESGPRAALWSDLLNRLEPDVRVGSG